MSLPPRAHHLIETLETLSAQHPELAQALEVLRRDPSDHRIAFYNGAHAEPFDCLLCAIRDQRAGRANDARWHLARAAEALGRAVDT